jgi:TPR repeat protein
VVGKLPSSGLVAKDASLGAASFETRFIGQYDQTYGASPSAAANKQPRLAEALRGAIADHASSTATDGASPSAAANEQPPLAEPLRQTDGASPSAANEQPRLVEPLRGPTVEHVPGRTGPTPSALNPDAITAFLKRGEDLVASGDFAAARVLLLRAAEVRDPKAALLLAATFDPIILQRTGAYGVVPDVPSAQHWYEKAKEFGSEEASRRLEMLARRQM